MINAIRVTCAILIHENKILVAQRGNTMHLPNKWEFPGGKIEPFESEEECLKREIKEELGLEIECLEMLPSSLHSYQENKTIDLIPFICSWTSGSIALKEHTEVRWMEVDKLTSLDWADADIPIVKYFQKWYAQKGGSQK